MQKRTCIKCGQQFILRPGKPGLSTTCPDCSVETTERKGGIMVWLNKHTPRLIVCSREEAAEYAQRTRRIGASVTAALTPKGRETGNPGTKLGSGAEKYATYTSPIGEKHHVKD